MSVLVLVIIVWEILQWYMTDEYTQRDDVLEFIFQDIIKMQNLKNAMILYRYNKNKSELKNFVGGKIKFPFGKIKLP
ncbi:hypothetical protein ACSCAY_001769 [Campylobacter jejuni]